MARLDNIKASIDAKIRTNGQQEITGQVLNTTLNEMVDGVEAVFAEHDTAITEQGEAIAEQGTKLEEQDAKLTELSEEVGSLIIGKSSDSSAYNGDNEVFDKIDGFVINSSSGAASAVYDTWYYRAQNAGTVKLTNLGNASWGRLAVSSDINIGAKPEHYEYTDTIGTSLSYEKGQVICVSASKGKSLWEIEVTEELPVLKKFMSPQLEEFEKEVAGVQEKISLLHNSVANAYKGNAPIPFKEKLLSASTDTTILLLGDSMTALTNNGSEVDGAANLPPGCQHDAITYQLFQLICRNKPQYDRFDSSVNSFTENGTFAISDVNKQNGTDTQYGEYSSDNCLYRETTVVNDSISFDWNLADYEKLNFIGRMGEDGTKIIRISCTPGMVQVRHNNRANPIADYTDGQLVEANGYEFTQFLPATANKAHWLRNFPIEFVRVATTGTITMTFTNVGEDGVGTMYYWGTERWNFVTTHIVNIARAGRNTNLLWRSIGEELNYRECDLLIWQMPLWNDFKSGGDVVPTTIVAHNALLEKIANNSDSWQKFQMIVNMYHTQSFSWIKNNNIQFQANGDSTRPKTIPNDWNCCAKLLENIKSNTNYSDNKITASNLYNEVIQFAIENGLTVEQLLTAGNGFTLDGVHLTTDGFAFYAGMIAAMVYD